MMERILWTGSERSPLEQLLFEFEQPGKEIIWVTVPSHVIVEGNNEADRLVEFGRLSSSLLAVLHSRVKTSHTDTPCIAPAAWIP